MCIYVTYVHPLLYTLNHLQITYNIEHKVNDMQITMLALWQIQVLLFGTFWNSPPLKYFQSRA